MQAANTESLAQKNTVHQRAERQLELARRYRNLTRQRWSLVLQCEDSHSALHRLLGSEARALLEATARWKAAFACGELTGDTVEVEALTALLIATGHSTTWITIVEDEVLKALSRPVQTWAVGMLPAQIERLRREQRRARDRLVQSSVDLVKAMARRYTRPRSRLPDATQEGYLGLLRAIDLFDPDLGIQFSTYATWWIRRAVCRNMLTSSTIRVPESIQLAARRHRRCAELARRVEGRALSVAEIARDSGDSEESVQHVRQWAKPRVHSLDQPARDASPTSPMVSLVADETSQLLFEKSEQRHTIDMLLRRLTNEEASIIRAHYGLDGEGEKRLAQIGEVLNVSRETVRQIEQRALTKLRELTLG